MRPLVIANLEPIEAELFLAAQMYGDNGYLIESVILPCDNGDDAVKIIQALSETYGCPSSEVWTSTRDIYKAGISTVGVAVSIKHPSDTSETKRIIADQRDLLVELYDIQTEPKLPPLPRWRSAICAWLKRITRTIEGDGKFEVRNDR